MHPKFWSDGEQADDWQIVKSPEAAVMLLDVKWRRVLSAFTRARRPSDVAKVLEIGLTTLMYQIERLVQVGLLVVTREESAGRRMRRRYQTSAARFFVPYELTPAETPERLLRAEWAAWEERLARGLARAGRKELDGQGLPVWGVRIERVGAGLEVRNAIGPDSTWNFLEAGAPALVDLWGDVRLSFEDAKALQHELCDLFGRYAARSGAQDYVLRLGLAPE